MNNPYHTNSSASFERPPQLGKSRCTQLVKREMLPLSSTMVVLDSVRGYFDRISTAKPEEKEQAMETRGATE